MFIHGLLQFHQICCGLFFLIVELFFDTRFWKEGWGAFCADFVLFCARALRWWAGRALVGGLGDRIGSVVVVAHTRSHRWNWGFVIVNVEEPHEILTEREIKQKTSTANGNKCSNVKRKLIAGEPPGLWQFCLFLFVFVVLTLSRLDRCYSIKPNCEHRQT